VMDAESGDDDRDDLTRKADEMNLEVDSKK